MLELVQFIVEFIQVIFVLVHVEEKQYYILSLKLVEGNFLDLVVPPGFGFDIRNSLV